MTLLEKGKELYRNDQDAEGGFGAFRKPSDSIRIWPRLISGLDWVTNRSESAKRPKPSTRKQLRLIRSISRKTDDDAEAHYALGQTYANLGPYSEAIREYREATKLKDDDPDIYYDLGVAHTKLAQYDAAAAAFSKSLEIDPDYYRAQDGLDEAKEGIKRIRAGTKASGRSIEETEGRGVEEGGRRSPPRRLQRS